MTAVRICKCIAVVSLARSLARLPVLLFIVSRPVLSCPVLSCPVLPCPQVDVVVPVPETSRIAAMHCAASLGLPFEEGLTKNRRGQTGVAISFSISPRLLVVVVLVALLLVVLMISQ